MAEDADVIWTTITKVDANVEARIALTKNDWLDKMGKPYSYIEETISGIGFALDLAEFYNEANKL